MTSPTPFVSAFNALNTVVLPLVKAGLANPLLVGCGLVVLEVPGRRSGRLRSTPLTSVALGRHLIVATVRGRSQWVRNLAAAQSGHVWWCGKRRAVRAEVFQPSGAPPEASQSGPTPAMSGVLDQLSRRADISIALLTVE